MSLPGDELEREARVRRNILRRASLYSLGMLAVTLAVAIGGSALIAWLLSRGGLPFGRTWLVLTMVVLAPPLVRIALHAWRGKRSATPRARPDRRVGPSL